MLNAVISTEITDEKELIEKARNWPSMEGLELATRVSRKEAQTVPSEGPYKVAAFDYGIKQNIIHNFTSRGCTLRIFHAEADLYNVKAWIADVCIYHTG